MATDQQIEKKHTTGTPVAGGGILDEDFKRLFAPFERRGRL
jgi:hypothetical protein